MVSRSLSSKFQKSSVKGSQSSDVQARPIHEVKEGIDHSAVASLLDLIKNTKSIDDRKLLLEHALVKLAHLPPGGEINAKLTQAVVSLLYNDLPHPAITTLGNEHAWRAADGAGNNVSIPDMGKAGTPYARNVQPAHPFPRHMLPDAGLLYDALLKREKFVPHPAGLNSLMFAFAALVIHTVFRTSHKDVNVNETSSYVDLAPLYGINAEAGNHIRVRDGRGLLHPDTFCEDRLLNLPPAVPALLILFNRNHNYIAKKLLEINERETWRDPDTVPADEPNRTQALLNQEEEIFQVARLVNCGWFASAVFSDYFSAILGLVREGNSWSLDVFSEFRKLDHSFFERGRGNICSVEFNCLYRWHATISEEDEAWTKQHLATTFPHKSLDEITPADFRTVMSDKRAQAMDLNYLPIADLKRQADMTFNDADLANLLKNATEHPAGAFKARGTPHSMRWMEIMGIEAARGWGCCSLNEFRRYLGLKPYASFKEWSRDQEVADAAEKLYHDIENLELYVGLQAEEPKPVVQGAGLCPGYTISRAILADAVGLIRGDRFFTADFNPYNLTAWGFADCQRTPEGSGYGSTLGRLFLRTLPTEFTENSTYTWFPQMTPPAISQILTDLGVKDTYDLTRPSSKTGPVEVKEYGEVSGILKNKATFQDPFLYRTSKIINGQGFFLATADPERGEREQRNIMRAIADTPERIDNIAKFFYDATRQLIARHSYTLVGGETKSVDILRDVLKAVPLQWVATQVAGIELKKNADDTSFAYTEGQLYEILVDAYSYFFENVDSSRVLKLGEKVQKDVKQLLHHIEANSGGSLKRFSLSNLFGTMSQFLTLSAKNGRQELASRLQQGGSADQISNSVLAVMIGASIELPEALVRMLDLLLEDPRISAVLSAETKDDSVLQAYISEVLRLSPPAQGVWREAKSEEKVGTQSLSQGQLVFLDIANAGLNERAFVNPKTVDPTRPELNHLKGDILTRTLGRPLLSKIMIAVLRAVFELDKVQRGPGQSGQLQRFTVDIDGMPVTRYLDQNQHFTQWAHSMVIQYEAKSSK